VQRQHSNKHTALCVVKTFTDFESNRAESQRPEVNFIMEYRLYDGTLKMRTAGYILWALCAQNWFSRLLCTAVVCWWNDQRQRYPLAAPRNEDGEEAAVN